MLNERKVRLMTQLAIYEKNGGREDIKLSKYFKSDYARLQALKTAVAVTISYIFLVLIIIVYKLEFIIDNALTLDYPAIGKMILGYYLVIMAVYIIAAMLGYSWKYRQSRKKLAKYFRMLRKLNHMYNVEDGYIVEDEEDVD